MTSTKSVALEANSSLLIPSQSFPLPPTSRTEVGEPQHYENSDEKIAMNLKIVVSLKLIMFHLGWFPHGALPDPSHLTNRRQRSWMRPRRSYTKAAVKRPRDHTREHVPCKKTGMFNSPPKLPLAALFLLSGKPSGSNKKKKTKLDWCLSGQEHPAGFDNQTRGLLPCCCPLPYPHSPLTTPQNNTLPCPGSSSPTHPEPPQP